MRLVTPESVEEAAGYLRAADGEIRILAGGTDLVVQIRAGRRQPQTLVDIKRIASLNQITRSDCGGWTVGAAVCAAEIWEHPGLRSDWPGFVEAVHLIGSMQVQGRATPVGNMCNASPAADSMPAAIAAAATVTVLGSEGQRVLPVEALVVAPGRTSLRAGEFVTAINLPRKPRRSGDAYLRLTPRAEMDIAVVGAAVSLTLDEGGRCIAARVALGAVAPTALLVPEAGEALVGSFVGEAALEEMAQAVAAACAPIDDKRGTAEYRIHTAPVMARRAAIKALQRARG